MGSGKRKRTSSPDPDPGSTSEAGSKRGSKKSRSSSAPVDQDASTDDRKLRIAFELVGTDKTYSYHDDSRSFERVVAKAAKRLGVSFLGLQMFHVRSGGLQVPLWDDYDFDALKKRAAMSRSKRELIRVYPPGRGATAPASAPVTVVSTPVASQRATSVPAVLGTPRSALRAPGGTPRSEKRVMYALPTDSPPNTPSPAPSNSPAASSSQPAGSKSRKRRAKKRSSLDNSAEAESNGQEPTSTPTSSTSAADRSASNDGRDAHHLVAKQTAASMFRPVRPSPLSQATMAESSDEEPSSKKQKASQVKVSPAKKKSADAISSPTKKPEPVSVTQPHVSASSSALKKGEAKQAKSARRRSRNSDLPPVYGDIPPVVGSISTEVADEPATAGRSTESRTHENVISDPQPAAPSSTPPAPTSALPPMSLQTPEGRKRALQEARAAAKAASSSPAPSAAMQQREESTTASADVSTSSATAPAKRGRRSKGAATAADTEPSSSDFAIEAAPSTSVGEAATETEASQKKQPRRRRKSGVATDDASTSVEDAIATDEPASTGKDAEVAPAKIASTPSNEGPADPSSEVVPPPKKMTAAQLRKEEMQLKKAKEKEEAVRRKQDEINAKKEAKAQAAKRKEEEAKTKKEAREKAAQARKAKTEAARLMKEQQQADKEAGPRSSQAEDGIESSEATSAAMDLKTAKEVADRPQNDVSPHQADCDRSAATNEKGGTSCALCNVIADHRFVDCPATKDPSGETLRKRAAERRAQLAEWRREAIKNGRKPSDFAEKHDEPLRIIEEWLKKVRNVGASVINGALGDREQYSQSVVEQRIVVMPDEVVEADSDENRDRATPEVMIAEAGSQTTPVTYTRTAVASPTKNGPAADEAMDLDVVEADDADDAPELSVSTKSVVGNAMGKEKPTPPVTPMREATSESSSSSSSQSSTPDAGEGGTPFLPQMLQRKAAMARRPGSRLSVSDAVIETGDSDSDSDNSDSGSEAGSDDSTSSDSDTESSSSSSSADVDPDELWRNVMRKPLTKQQQHRARLSLASMHPTQEMSDPDDHVSDDEKEDTLLQRSQRRGSESSIGEFEEDNNSPAPSDVEDSDEDEKRQALLSAVADRTMEIDEQEDDVQTDSDEEGPAVTANRSFTLLAERAGSSPALDDFPGDRALQEVIEEDDGMEFTQEPIKEPGEFSATQPIEIESVEPQSAPSLETAPEPSPAKRRGRLPNSASQKAAEDESESAERTSQPKTSQEARESEPSPEAEPPQLTRRSTRAAAKSKEPPASQPVTRGRVTRAAARVVSSSQPTRRVTRSSSQEPEPLAISGSKAPSSQDIAEESASEPEPDVTAKEAPRSARKKPVTYSRSSRRKSETKSVEDDSEPEAEAEKGADANEVLIEPTPAQRVPSSLPPSSFPRAQGSSQPLSSQVNGKTQSSPSRQNGEGSPLFLSQPTQLPQTQAYNPNPEPLVPETQAPNSGPVQPSSPQPASSPSPRTTPQPNSRVNGKPNGQANGGGDDESEDGDSDSGDAAYNQPISLSLSQRNPAPPMLSSFPTLSQLPKDLLRQGRDAGAGFINRLTRSSVAGVVPSATQQHDDSDSDDEDDDDDSSEDEVPEERRQRYAGRRKRPSTIGQTVGW